LQCGYDQFSEMSAHELTYDRSMRVFAHVNMSSKWAFHMRIKTCSHSARTNRYIDTRIHIRRAAGFEVVDKLLAENSVLVLHEHENDVHDSILRQSLWLVSLHMYVCVCVCVCMYVCVYGDDSPA